MKKSDMGLFLQMGNTRSGDKKPAQLEDAFSGVSAKTCSGLIKKVRKVEDRFWEEDVLLDDNI